MDYAHGAHPWGTRLGVIPQVEATCKEASLFQSRSDFACERLASGLPMIYFVLRPSDTKRIIIQCLFFNFFFLKFISSGLDSSTERTVE